MLFPQLLPGVLLLALAQPAPPDIAVKDQGQYIGNLISPVYTLTIGDAKTKTWRYTLVDNRSGTAKDAPTRVTAGTYEFDGDLVIFTGSHLDDDKKPREAREVCFALNFGKAAGGVAFNRFFAAGDDTLRYHRKWFRKTAKGWQPAEEVILTIPRPTPADDAKTWDVAFKGERILWGEDGKRTVEAVEARVTFQKGEYIPAYYHTDAVPKPWLPRELILEAAGGRIASVQVEFPGVGLLRGFRPWLATK
jgi:hypothetical protein